MRHIDPNTVWAMKQLLKRKFERLLEANDKTYHTFSNEKPDLVFTLTVNAHEFTSLVQERDLAISRSRYTALLKKNEELEQELEGLKSTYCIWPKVEQAVQE